MKRVILFQSAGDDNNFSAYNQFDATIGGGFGVWAWGTLHFGIERGTKGAVRQAIPSLNNSLWMALEASIYD